jgi:mycothiol synthase
MIRSHLDDLPALAVPDGYAIRSFQEGSGDDAAWERIITESFQRDNSSFEREIRFQAPFRPERVWFATWKGEPVATATAWESPDWPDSGYLHMVGAVSSHTGKKLGFAVSLASMLQMQREGWKKAVLQTDDFRIPAIRTYLNLGFIPRFVHDNQQQRWLDIAGRLGIPSLRCFDLQGNLVTLTSS